MTSTRVPESKRCRPRTPTGPPHPPCPLPNAAKHSPREGRPSHGRVPPATPNVPPARPACVCAEGGEAPRPQRCGAARRGRRAPRRGGAKGPRPRPRLRTRRSSGRGRRGRRRGRGGAAVGCRMRGSSTEHLRAQQHRGTRTRGGSLGAQDDAPCTASPKHTALDGGAGPTSARVLQGLPERRSDAEDGLSDTIAEVGGSSGGVRETSSRL